jgi:hypothetical protein
MARSDAAFGMGWRRRDVSRRRLLAWSGGFAATVLGVAACGPELGGRAGSTATSPVAGTFTASGGVAAPPASNVLAANVNEALDKIDFDEMKAVAGSWIRGFYPMTDADQGDPAGQAGPAKLLDAAAKGYGTVLTMKFQYRDQPIPAPGSTAMKTALTRLNKVLAATMGKVDILTVGNEPFIETSKADRGTPALNVFYEALALHTVRYRRAHGGANCKTKVYMGALTGLDKPGAETAQTRRWMTFAAGNPSIAGVDIHPHVAGATGAGKFVDYVLPFLRRDQKFLATEFSLVHLWKQHNADPVDPDFARHYGVASGTPVWRFIRRAAHNHVSEQEWNDFVLSCSWFANHKDFLTQQMARFRGTGKLAVAGYGIVQAAPILDFGPNSAPWVLNCLFPQYVTRPGPGGLPGRNRTWCDEFRAAQQN